jgi:hypothetical protein
VPIPRPAPGAAKWWAVATIGILLGSAMAVWWGLASTVGRPSWTVMGYHVIDDRRVEVTYVVSRPAGQDVTCMLHALDKRFATVGLVEVQVPASGTSSVKRTTTIRTTQRAVTGVVKSCTTG